MAVQGHGREWMRVVLVVSAAVLLLSGCSDPKKASKSNFAHAINGYLEKHPLCFSAPTSDVKPAGREVVSRDVV